MEKFKSLVLKINTPVADYNTSAGDRFSFKREEKSNRWGLWPERPPSGLPSASYYKSKLEGMSSLSTLQKIPTRYFFENRRWTSWRGWLSGRNTNLQNATRITLSGTRLLIFMMIGVPTTICNSIILIINVGSWAAANLCLSLILFDKCRCFSYILRWLHLCCAYL